jgi:hypothetical protein
MDCAQETENVKFFQARIIRHPGDSVGSVYRNVRMMNNGGNPKKLGEYRSLPS